LGLTFVNSITKVLTILYFDSFSNSFYLLFFLYVIQFQMISEIFLTYSQLAMKNESKESPPFWTFFHTNVTSWSATIRFFAGPRKRFLALQTLKSCNLHSWNFWNFFYVFSNQHSTNSCVQKCFFFLKFGTCNRNGSIGAFWWNHNKKPFRHKPPNDNFHYKWQ